MFLFTWQTLVRVSDSGMSILLHFFCCHSISYLASLLALRKLDEFIKLLPHNTAAAKQVIENISDCFFLNMPVVHNAIQLSLLIY